MKKTMLILLTLLLTAVLACALAEEAEPTVYTCGDYEYILLEDGTAEIVGAYYTGSETELLLPASLDGNTVTVLGDHAFYKRVTRATYASSFPAVTSIIIPNSVTTIGTSTFAYCESLVSIQIPDSITAIGDYAFTHCNSLTSVSIPDSVVFIGANPFHSCAKLTSITVSLDHPTLTTIDGVLFEKSTKTFICYPCALIAKNYAIPQGIQVIGDYALCDCDSLTSVSIPNSVTSFGEMAFANCDSLASVSIPDSVTSIGDYTFNNCSTLTSVSIPNSVTSIGHRTFYACDSLTSVSIPDSVTSIGEIAFAYCSALTSVSIPDSVTSIRDNAFFNCPNITLTVPRDSYAEAWCQNNNLPYTYSDAND